MNPDERSQFLQTYANGPRILKAALDELPEKMRRFKPAPDKWSIHEIIVHVADCEVQSHVRCRMILAEPGASIPGHDEYQWSVALNYLDRDMQEALGIISMMRATNTGLLQSIADPLWQNYGVHSSRGKITLDELMQGYVSHITGHIAQMQRTFAAWKAAPHHVL